MMNLSTVFQTIMQNEVISRLFFVSLEMALLAVMVFLIIRIGRIRNHRFAAFLWLVVLAKPLLGLAFGTPVSLIEIKDPVNESAVIMSFSSGEQLDAMVNAKLEADKESLANREAIMPQASTVTSETGSSLSTASSSETGVKGKRVIFSISGILSGAWFAGVLLFLGITLIDQRKVRRMLRQSVPASGLLKELYGNLLSDMNISRAPDLKITDDLDSPALVGFFKPCILMPSWIAEDGNESRMEWLLRHELTHWKHLDPLALILRRISEILFYFHPAVWFSGKRWEEAMELACDRALLEEKPEAKRYADEIYSLLEHQQDRLRRPMAAGIFATRTQIGKRISALLTNPLSIPSRLGKVSVALLVIIALAGLGLGIGFAGKAAKADDSESQVEDENHEEFIRGIYARTASDLRSLHTAMECYYVDYNQYPVKPYALTTPVAYITEVPPDYFSGDVRPWEKGKSFEEIKDDPYPENLKIELSKENVSIYMYSVGPDGIDGRAEVTFDPTNGTISGGDVVRVIDLKERAYRNFADNEVTKKVQKQSEALTTLVNAVEAWYLDHDHELPESLEQLVEPDAYIKEIPEDMFAPGNPVNYILDREGGVALVYSVGPDGDDDGGIKNLWGYYFEPGTPDGDIVVKVNKENLEKLYHPRNASSENIDKTTDPFLKKILEMKAEDGMDNALINYQQASKMMPDVPNNFQTEMIARVLKEGWNEDAESLLPYIKIWNPALTEIRKGVEVGYAQNPHCEGPSTPVPNFLFAQISAKILCVEGNYLESGGEYKDALEDYMTALNMGRDYAAPDALLIGHLISIAIEQIATRQIYELAVSGIPDVPTLESIIVRLWAVENGHPDMVSAFENEAECMRWVFRKMKTDDPQFGTEKMAQALKEQYGTDVSEDIHTLADTLLEHHKKFWDNELEYIRKPYWERNPEEHGQEREKIVQQSHPFLKVALPNFMEADVRYLHKTVNLRKARIAAALAIYRARNGRFPASLSELTPDILQELPKDPFSGKNFKYEAKKNGASFELYSIGPDRINNDSSPKYDPTNGTVSGGDILY